MLLYIQQTITNKEIEMNEKIEKLEKLGGKFWEGGSHKRVYFNADSILRNSGLEVNRYESGNISSATYKGKKISNSWAKEIINKIQYGKLYYDINTDKIMHAGNFRDISEEIINDFLKKIRESLAL
jgi:hypothetical protein